MDKPDLIDAALQHLQDEGLKSLEAERQRYIDHMLRVLVDRFLAWPLPKDFGPDCGISFTKPNLSWPTGTNLFTAEQALAMFKHALGMKDA